MSAERVLCVVVTHNRCDTVVKTLAAIAGQERAPDAVAVVDNASTDGTEAALTAYSAMPITVLRAGQNLGAAAGRGLGMTWAVDHDFDWCWMVDDDSPPRPAALARLLEAAAVSRRCGMVGIRGGYRRFGLIRHIDGGVGPHPIASSTGLALGRVDFVHLDGALVAASAIRDCGVPRSDYFIMLEDVEYPLRLGDRGWNIVLLDEPIVDLGHMGAAAPWRLYYQTRNELLMARDRGSALGAAAWAVRNATFIYGHLRWSDNRRERLRYRALGAWDGIRNVRGRTYGPQGRLTFGDTPPVDRPAYQVTRTT